MSGYTPLFLSIIASTIWRESKETKIVWVTILAMCDARGMVEASIPGLADMAKVSLEECKSALAVLMAPDEYSRTKEHDGRRIEEVDGGWHLLNHAKFREKCRERAGYMREYRQKKAECNQNVTNVTASNRPLPPVTDTYSNSTHTQTREEYTYTLADCMSASEGIGMAKRDIEAFWANYAAVGWIDAARRKITNLKAALAKWKDNQPSHGKKYAPEKETSKKRINPQDARHEAVKALLLNLERCGINQDDFSRCLSAGNDKYRNFGHNADGQSVCDEALDMIKLRRRLAKKEGINA